MKNPSKPIVSEGILHPDQIEVGSVNWFKWLAEPQSASFNYEDSAGKFNARKESRKTSQNEYWSAYKRLGGRLRKVYIGLNDQLTPERLTRVCQDINQSETEFWLNRHSYTTADCVTTQSKNSYTITPQLQVTQDSCVTDNSELKALKVEVEQLKLELRTLQRQNAHLQKENTYLQQRHEEREPILNDLIHQKVSLTSGIVEFSQDLRQAEQERSQLIDEIERLKQEPPLPDLEAVRDRILSSLKVGKQAPEYKRTKAAIDRFIAEVRSE